MSNAQDRFFPKASGPVNAHPGLDFPAPQRPGKEKEAEAPYDLGLTADREAAPDEPGWYAKWTAEHPDNCPCNEPEAG